MPGLKKGNWNERADKSKFMCYTLIIFIIVFIFVFWLLAVVFDFVFIVGITGKLPNIVEILLFLTLYSIIFVH